MTALRRSSTLVLLLLSATAAAQSSRAVAEAGEEDRDLVGALRHVQLLGVSEEQPQTMRFATSTRGGIAVFEREIRDRAPLGEPVAFLETGYRVLSFWTWSSRVPWRLVDVGEESWLVARDPEAKTLVVQRFPTGERVAELEDVGAFEDARVVEDELQVLVRRGEGIVLATVGLDSNELESKLLLDGVSRFAAACFLAAAPGEAPYDLAVVATYEAHSPVVERIELTTGESHRFPTSAGEIKESTLRVAARRDGAVDRVAVGLPQHADGWGRVESLEIRVDEPRSVATTFWPFDQPTDGSEHSVNTTEYGQTLGFTADADGDGRSDLAVGASYGGFTEHVDLLSLGKQRRVRRFYSTTHMHRFGSSVSVSPCGRFVLACGGYVTYPEDLDMGAAASVLGAANRGERISTFLMPGER